MDVRGLVRRSPVLIQPVATLEQAARTMNEAGVGALLVVERGALVGILSERDLVAALADGADLRTTVWDHLVPEPFTVRPDAHVGEAARIMADKEVRHLPVVAGDGALLGMVSLRDLLFAALEETAGEARADWIEYLQPVADSSAADGG